MNTDWTVPVFIVGILAVLKVREVYGDFSTVEAALFVFSVTSLATIGILVAYEFWSKSGKDRRKRIKKVREIPKFLVTTPAAGVYLGRDLDLHVSVYLPDLVRARHVHILGATGSGKTEAVILNLIGQDVSRGYGAIILDAKGDSAFIQALRRMVPEDRLRIFDLGSEASLSYDPLAAGNPFEAAQRLFSSLQWSEEYYKSKALSALQRIFQVHHKKLGKNPTLDDLHHYLETEQNYTSALNDSLYPVKLASKDFAELSGLRDQLRGLTVGYLKTILSPVGLPGVCLDDARIGKVLYFRLQSLLSPQLVATIGKLVINHLNFIAGTAHRQESADITEFKMLPVYLDEFASFACPEFADLISKARSAGLALHFSHQSIGDLTEVSPGFLSRITDNSATKIVLRINDPDSAEQMSRTFGTVLYQKATQRITNTKDLDTAEVVGEGSQREAHQFRASPDLLKTLPTGVGSVLIAHGEATPHGASTVFKVQFPRLGAPLPSV